MTPPAWPWVPSVRSVVVAALLAATFLGARVEAVPAAAVEERRVVFSVRNENTSLLPCPADGASYEIHGSLVGPRQLLGRREASAATLYLHGATGGEFVWRDRSLPGYDYARELAKRGHVSVAIDRLGYDASGHPDGTQTCFGSEATIARQLIEQLRAGAYSTDQGPATRFARIALAGFSQGGAVAELESASFGAEDALVVIGWTDGSTALATGDTIEQTPRISRTCFTGGEPAEDEPGSPLGYVYAWATPAETEATLFHNVEPAVAAAYMTRVNRDGCGIYASFLNVQATNLTHLPRITSPVLLIFGNQDVLFGPEDRRRHRERFVGSGDVSLINIDPAGHAVMASRTAERFQAAVARWLQQRGY